MHKEPNLSKSTCGQDTFCLPDSVTVNRVLAMEHPEIIRDSTNDNPPLPPKPYVSLDAGSLCPACGSDMVTIRGKYPNSPGRIVCPFCLAECIDTIRKLIDGKKEISPCAYPGTVILHNRSKFYGKLIYWYEFLKCKNIPRGFLNVPSTPYYEFGGTHQNAMEKLAGFTIVGGSDL